MMIRLTVYVILLALRYQVYKIVDKKGKYLY
jgi:hypothetical protein